MNNEEFRQYGHLLVDQIADYLANIGDYKVIPDILPGEIFNKLPESPPEKPDDMGSLLHDFNEVIMPGMTHWNSPSFHGYFPANNSYPSILAEFLTSGIGAQCMLWQTSPAATELEEKMMIWLRQMIGLTDDFTGVIQDTASTSTLVAVLTAREKKAGFNINNDGFITNKYRIYCSEEAHSSIEKAIKIAGIGKRNLVKIPVDDKFAMIPAKLDEAVKKDIDSGFVPLLVVGAFGTTGSLAVDPIEEIAEIARRYDMWLHVDAAYLGTAMILPEYRHMMKGCIHADSFVFNPHKWMMTNFDCSAYFVKDKESLIRTFEIMPEYLKTEHDNHVNNYRDWGIQLGRRFRALKLWFVVRTYGVKGLQDKVRNDINLGRFALSELKDIKGVEILAPVDFNLICFRYNDGNDDVEHLNELNAKILSAINKTGDVFMTHTKLNGKYAIRIVIAQTNVEQKHIEKLIKTIKECINIAEIK